MAIIEVPMLKEEVTPGVGSVPPAIEAVKEISHRLTRMTQIKTDQRHA
jgi:hypothetical protein